MPGGPGSGNGLEFYDACWCAGTGCGGHIVLNPAFATITPVGWQGAAQHTWTLGCDGFHEPGQCPRQDQEVS